MSLKSFIRGLIREELSGASAPVLPEASTKMGGTDRSAIFARLHELRAKQSALDARKVDIQADEARVAHLEVELAEAWGRVRAHHANIWAEWIDNSVAIDKELALLRGTSSRQLDEFIHCMDEEYAALVRRKPIEEFQLGEKDLLAENPKTPRHVFSDSPSISRRAAAVLAARAKAEELKLLDLSEDALTVALDGLRMALPTIDTLELVGRA